MSFALNYSCTSEQNQVYLKRLGTLSFYFLVDLSYQSENIDILNSDSLKLMFQQENSRYSILDIKIHKNVLSRCLYFTRQVT